MRLATFNVENMFQRPVIMNLDDWKDGEQTLADHAELTSLIRCETYSDDVKEKLLTVMKRHRGLLQTGRSKYIILREVREKLLRRPKRRPVEIAVDGRDEWSGWFELVREEVKETAIENTARVIDAVAAQVLCVVEVEDRIALKRFNEGFIREFALGPYRHLMVIDGNDERGIDVGILTQAGYPIVSICSHVDDEDAVGPIFSRDCAEYTVQTPNGGTLLVLVNHFKSKGYGSPESSDAKRERQAKRVREIYEQRLKEGYAEIAIVGDLNDTPDSDPLAPLLQGRSTLIDVMSHPKFANDGRPGTYGNGTKSQKIDYILLSPALGRRVKAAGIERRGVWGGKNGDLFPHFDEVKTKRDAASDHAALWVELDL